MAQTNEAVFADAQPAPMEENTFPRVYSGEELAAALRLQSAWRCIFRWRRSQRIAAQFIAHGMTSAIAQSTPSLNTLHERLRDAAMVRRSKACIGRIFTLTSMRIAGSEDPTMPLAPQHINVRVFLSAFMIAFFPNNTFEVITEREQGLIEMAREMIPAMERVMLVLANGDGFAAVPLDEAVALGRTMRLFLQRFQEWKATDELKLKTRITHALIALYQARENVVMPAEDRLRTEMNQQIERLRATLARVCGAATLAAFDAEHPQDAPNAPPMGPGGIVLRTANEALAHELLINPAFTLNDDGGLRVGAEQHPAYRRVVVGFHRVCAARD